MEKEIIFRDPKKTFMEILKVHNKEVPFANLLAFFFRPKETHELGTLFIDSLLELINNKEYSTLEEIDYDRKSKIEVHVEKKTSNGTRIDLLIVTNTFVICIEFKIDHDLDNPLNDYKTYIEEHSKYSQLKKLYIVLTPYKKAAIKLAEIYLKSNSDFNQFILSDFIAVVKEKRAKYENKENDSFKYFEDFIQTVENRKIRYKRESKLKSLKNELNITLFNKGLESIFHSNNQGGFLEILQGKNAIKVRIKDGDWQIEKWENNTSQLPIKLEYNTIISKVNELTECTL
jgi:hypothetical protein